MDKIRQSVSGWPAAILTSLFTPVPAVKTRVVVFIWIAALYLLGVYWLGVFFNWGDHTLFFQDWADITGPRTQLLRTAAQTNQLPLHISDPSTMHGNTVRFLAVPDTMISPQYLLLKRFSIQRFQFLNVLAFYTLGFAGLLVLMKKFNLSVITLSILSLLFNFNGNILAHFSVGHMTWVGYFLFPWFVWLIFRLLEGDHSWKWVFGMSSLMFIIWLQGSFHQYLWLLIFLGLIGLFVPGNFWMISRTGFFILLMSAFRILPSILLYGRYSASYITGYPTLFVLWDSLVHIANPTGGGIVTFPLGIEGVSPWEMTNFIGLLGAGFTIYFGLVQGTLSSKSPFQKLFWPIGGMLLLSMGQFMGYLRLLPIPLIQGERVGTRIISVVLAFLFIIGAERLQRWLEQHNSNVVCRIGILLGFSITMMELWINLKVWSIPNAVKDFWWVYYDVDKWYVKNNWGDTTYLFLVFGGLGISLLTLAGLTFLSLKENKKREAISPSAVGKLK